LLHLVVSEQCGEDVVVIRLHALLLLRDEVRGVRVDLVWSVTAFMGGIRD